MSDLSLNYDFGTPSSDPLAGATAAPDFSTHAADISLSETVSGNNSIYGGGTVLGFLPSGSLSGQTNVLTAPAATANDDIFRGFNQSLESIGKVANNAGGLYNTIQGFINPTQKNNQVLTASPSAPVQQPYAPAAKTWLPGVPNSVVIVGGVGLLIVVGIIAIK